MSGKLLIATVIIFLGLAFSMFLFIDSFDNKFSEATGLAVSSESFPTYLETHPAIENMPKSSSIGIVIGNRNYEIEGKNVYLSDKQKINDIKITLPEDYEAVIGDLGLCEAVRKATKNNEFGVDFHINKAILLLKYRKLLKYGGCLK